MKKIFLMVMLLICANQQVSASQPSLLSKVKAIFGFGVTEKAKDVKPLSAREVTAKHDQELIDAAKALDIIGIHNALRAGANPNAIDASGRSVLMHIATSQGVVAADGTSDYSLLPQIITKLMHFGADCTRGKSLFKNNPLGCMASRLQIEHPSLPLVPMARAFLQGMASSPYENDPSIDIGNMIIAALYNIKRWKSWDKEANANPFYDLIKDALKIGFDTKQRIELYADNVYGDACVVAQRLELPRALALFTESRAAQKNRAQEVLNDSLPVDALHCLIFEY